MAVQMYLVHPRDNDDDEAREAIADFIAQRRGFILMATSYGSIIAAFDERYLDEVKGHYLVEFANGVSLNLNSPGAAALKQIFAQNIALQLVDRGISPTPPAQPEQRPTSAAGSFPPGYRPLRWQHATNEVDDQEGGE